MDDVLFLLMVVGIFLLGMMVGSSMVQYSVIQGCNTTHTFIIKNTGYTCEKIKEDK